MLKFFKNPFNSSKGESVLRYLTLDRPDSYILVEDMINGTNHYHLDDPNKLEEIKKKWTFKTKDSTCRCIGDYSFMIVPHLRITLVRVCFTCNNLSVRGEGESEFYSIDETSVRNLLKEDFNPIRAVKKSFKDKEEANGLLGN